MLSIFTCGKYTLLLLSTHHLDSPLTFLFYGPWLLANYIIFWDKKYMFCKAE